MSKLRGLLVAFGLLSLHVPVRAQGPLELFPEDAVASLAVRDLDELIKRGDKFLTDTDIRVGFRPSQLFEEANRFLGIQAGLDRKKAAGIVLLRPEKADERLGLQQLEQLIVPIIPFTDADAMAGNFGIDKGMLKTDAVKKTKKMDFGKYAGRSKSHLYLSESETSILRALGSKRVADSFTAEQKTRINESDLLLHLGRYIWEKEADIPAEWLTRFAADGDPVEKEFARQFAASVEETQHAIIGARLNQGIDLHFLASFPPKGEAAKFMQSLRGKAPGSTLKGLPDGNVLIAQASSGDTNQQALLAKTLFNFLIEDFLIRQKLVAPVDRLNYLGVFNEVLRHLQGNRFAVYHNVDEKKHGLFTVIAVLDTENGPGFVQAMRILSKMAVADKLDWTKAAVKEEIDVDRLVRDLGSSVYAVRQSATTKLALIGEPSLPYLEKALDTKRLDLETTRRARELRDRISAVAAERRKALLDKNSNPFVLRPTMTFIANAEKRGDRTVDVIQIKLGDPIKDEKGGKVAVHSYQDVFGVDWDKIRLTVVGNQIVVMLGSNRELYDAALRHVAKGEPGLAGSKRLATYHERAAANRSFELHMSIEGLLRLVEPKIQRDTPAQISSVALTLSPTTLQVDARVPTAEVRVIAKKAQEAFGN
jgi:hypothetical protein